MAKRDVKISGRLPKSTKLRMALAKTLAWMRLWKLARWVVRELRWQYRIGDGEWRDGGVVKVSIEPR